MRLARVVAAAALATGAALSVAAPAKASGWEFGGDYFAAVDCIDGGQWGAANGWWTDWYCTGPIHGFHFLYVYVP